MLPNKKIETNDEFRYQLHHEGFDSKIASKIPDDNNVNEIVPEAIHANKNSPKSKEKRKKRKCINSTSVDPLNNSQPVKSKIKKLSSIFQNFRTNSKTAKAKYTFKSEEMIIMNSEIKRCIIMLLLVDKSETSVECQSKPNFEPISSTNVIDEQKNTNQNGMDFSSNLEDH